MLEQEGLKAAITHIRRISERKKLIVSLWVFGRELDHAIQTSLMIEPRYRNHLCTSIERDQKSVEGKSDKFQAARKD